MEYKILKANKIDEMEKLVNECIKRGWKPQGGICESGEEGDLFLLQAMIKE